MLRRMLYKKIMVATSILLVILMLYLIPSNKGELEIEQRLEYVYPNEVDTIYLLDNYDKISRTMISVNKQNEISKAIDLLDGLTINGKKQDKLPNGFRGLLPVGTRVLDISLHNKILKIDFSKEFNNIKMEYEEKLIESLVYTLTDIDGVDKIEIFIEGVKLKELPNSKKLLPEYLDKGYGINKEYELTNLNDIDSYTIYYVMNYNDEVYYTPITKYINNQGQDKVKIIIDELATNLTYESNLMSYLDSNIKLLDYEIVDKTIKLDFNEAILSNITSSKILEEVKYTIGLSLCDELEIEKVIFLVNNKEISTFSLKSIEK
jgi:spore germination protein gerM